MGNFSKIDINNREAHFTPDNLADEMLEMLNRYYTQPITEFLETSAGDGRLLRLFGTTSYLAYDIEEHIDNDNSELLLP